jgi:diketogulonate reductase-like aldo/keto reductase
MPRRSAFGRRDVVYSMHMQRKSFGWTDVAVPVIGQGTWRMGDRQRQRAAEIAALRAGVGLGLTHIDTAEMYGGGGAEEAIAEVLCDVRRAAVFLVSKVLPDNATYKGTLKAAERSLRRLRTDYIDLYLLHWPGSHPIGETMRAMEELVAAGKIRFLGVSNFDVDELREAMGALSRERIASNQVLYNLGARGIERDLLPFCAAEGIAIVGYTPFGNWPRAGSAALRVLSEIGKRHGKTAHQVALRFLTRTPELFAIPKASDVTHVGENAGAVDFELDDDDIAAIDRAFPAPKRNVPLASA